MILRIEVYSEREISLDGWKTTFKAVDVGPHGTEAVAGSPSRAVRRLMRQLRRQERHQRRYHNGS